MPQIEYVVQEEPKKTFFRSSAKELAFIEESFIPQLYHMEITPSISEGKFGTAGEQILQSGLETMRENNEKLYLRCVHLEASNKRLKETLQKFANLEQAVVERAILAIESEPKL